MAWMKAFGPAPSQPKVSDASVSLAVGDRERALLCSPFLLVGFLKKQQKTKQNESECMDPSC